MASAETLASFTADGVDLIDKDDGWSLFLGVLEEIPDSSGSHAGIKFHELAATD